MIGYVGLTVQVHGLNDPNTEIIRRKVLDALVAALDPAHAGDIDVEVDEYAGTPEP